MASRMQQRRGTAAEWAAANPVLADGEAGYERDTHIFKVGDGSSTWNQLPPALNGQYLGVSGKAYDSDRLDGLDSTAFAQKSYVDGLVTPTGASRSLVNHFGSGTAFPTTGIKLGDRYYRSDLFCDFLWNGGVWRQVSRAGGTSAQRTAISTSNTGLYAGFEFFETDTNRFYVFNGTAWLYRGGGSPPLTNVPWTNTAVFADWDYNSFGRPKYGMDASGRVMAQGLAKAAVNVTSVTTLFNFPTGFRPNMTHLFMIPINATASARFDVTTSGNVTYQANVTGGIPAGSFFPLDGIMFWPANN